MKSNKGGEYYDKFDESGQYKGPFAKLVESRGIHAEYIMFGTPHKMV